MALLTKTQFRDAVKREARLESTNDLDTMIYEIMDNVTDDIFNQERCYELMLVDTQLSLTNATATTALPATFQHVDEVRFTTDSGVTFTRLFPKNDFSLVQSAGLPKWYFISGANLFIFPYSLVTSSHKIYLNFYKLPVFTADSDTFPSLRFQAAAKMQVVQRLLAYHGTLDRAAAASAASEQSIQRAFASNPVQRGLDSVDTRSPNMRIIPDDAK